MSVYFLVFGCIISACCGVYLIFYILHTYLTCAPVPESIREYENIIAPSPVQLFATRPAKNRPGREQKIVGCETQHLDEKDGAVSTLTSTRSSLACISGTQPTHHIRAQTYTIDNVCVYAQ